MAMSGWAQFDQREDVQYEHPRVYCRMFRGFPEAISGFKSARAQRASESRNISCHDRHQRRVYQSMRGRPGM